MRIFLTLIFLTLIERTYAQKLPEIGMNIRIAGPDQTVLAEIRPTRMDDRVSTSSTYYWYSAGAIHQSQGSYSGKVLNGTYQEFYNNKNLKTQGFFKNGLKNGSWKSWASNGKLAEITSYKNGEKHGDFNAFDDTGKLIKSGSYKHEQLNGNLLTYQKDSVVTTKYHNGQLIPKKTGPSFWNKLNIFKKKKAGDAKPKTKK